MGSTFKPCFTALSLALACSLSLQAQAYTERQIIGVWQCSTIQDLDPVVLEIASTDRFLAGGNTLNVGRIVVKMKQSNKTIAGYEFNATGSYELSGEQLTSSMQSLQMKNIANPEFEKMIKLIDQLEASIGESVVSVVQSLDKNQFIIEEQQFGTLTACSRKQ